MRYQGESGEIVISAELLELVVLVLGGVLGATGAAVVLLVRCVRRGGDVEAAVRRERGRLARELHDVLGNRLVTISLQARTLPEPVRAGARAIDDLARVAMQDVRQVLKGLHTGGACGQERAATVLAEVVDLAGRLPQGRALVHVDRPPGPGCLVSAATRWAVVRIAQECLSNAVKHGEGTVVLGVSFGDQVVIMVDNEVRPRRAAEPDEGSGLGLPGIRVRAAELGGTALWGEVGGRFRIRVALPVEQAAAGGYRFKRVLRGDCHA